MYLNRRYFQSQPRDLGKSWQSATVERWSNVSEVRSSKLSWIWWLQDRFSGPRCLSQWPTRRDTAHFSLSEWNWLGTCSSPPPEQLFPLLTRGAHDRAVYCPIAWNRDSSSREVLKANKITVLWNGTPWVLVDMFRYLSATCYINRRMKVSIDLGGGELVRVMGTEWLANQSQLVIFSVEREGA
jgi:hypothetical protein